MRYDINLIRALCRDFGLEIKFLSNDRIDVEIEKSVVLVFANIEGKDDCALGFDGSFWHNHGNITFSDSASRRIEMNYLDIISGLKDGQILIGESWIEGKLTNRWLLHRDCNDEFLSWIEDKKPESAESVLAKLHEKRLADLTWYKKSGTGKLAHLRKLRFRSMTKDQFGHFEGEQAKLILRLRSR